MVSPSSQPLIDGWLREFQGLGQYNNQDNPNYLKGAPQTLITSSQAIAFNIGTGHDVFTSMLAKCESAQQELIIVTCFWAKSSSQEAVASLLIKLSTKALIQNRKIQVRICFSSISFMQKLFQTSSLDGKIYSPSSWINLGLPSPDELTGLELVVKSIFVRPFSVMHPKFILMDRRHAFMPSCNVSWEQWFEGCIEMTGGISEKLFDFWVAFWSSGASLPPLINIEPEVLEPPQELTSGIKQIVFPSPAPTQSTILLPSPHHLNPNFHFFSTPQPPSTPLNTFILYAISHAKATIYTQTPNLTCAPVISALLAALCRGVDVHIVTSSRLMILEQLVTAGTITEFEVWKLRRHHRKLLKHYHQTLTQLDPENLMEMPGKLRIDYYRPRRTELNEPVKSHFKCTMVDQEVIVLGSGNMDRASWFTSQELGVAFLSRQIATSIMSAVEEGLNQRVRHVC